MSESYDINKIVSSDSFKEAVERAKVRFELLESISKDVGKFGWTIPVSSSFATFAERDLIKKGSFTKEDIDVFFQTYYSEDDNFDKMLDRILSNKNIEQWHEAIEQCILAHKNKKYILSISTLIPVLEGILATFESNKTNTKMMKVCREMLEQSNGDFFQRIMWTSCYDFISTLYQKSDFSGTEPEIINRHWILHGRTAFNNSEIDSIRIFNAVETVSNVLIFYILTRKKNKG